MSAPRWVGLVIVGAALVFALEGGEYGTWDWLTLRREERAQAAAIAELEAAIDSLEREAVALERDPRVQERVARERFGMIRRGEFLYKLVPPEDP
ncbi:MAG TPA: septum formation initiator family protein [Gemmatimonadales bacterium]|nr:septum formation initiator family protein [Gemmatimonadales bacterium]